MLVPPFTKPILIRMKTVMVLTGLARSTIYKLIHQGRFPPPLKIGERIVAWRAADILDWVEDRTIALSPSSSEVAKR